MPGGTSGADASERALRQIDIIVHRWKREHHGRSEDRRKVFSTEQLNYKLSHSEDQGRYFDFEAPVLLLVGDSSTFFRILRASLCAAREGACVQTTSLA